MQACRALTIASISLLFLKQNHLIVTAKTKIKIKPTGMTRTSAAKPERSNSFPFTTAGGISDAIEQSTLKVNHNNIIASITHAHISK